MNSSKRSVTPLVLEPRPSRRLITLFTGFHLGALVLLPALPLPASMLWALALLLGLSGYAVWRQLRRRVVLTWAADGGWWWEEGGEALPLRLLADSTLLGGLVVLNFALEGRRGRRSLLLATDSLEPDLGRQLRVRLRLDGGRDPNQAPR